MQLLAILLLSNAYSEYIVHMNSVPPDILSSWIFTHL